MATVGQALTAPETGWVRFDDTDNHFVYAGSGWASGTTSGATYNGTWHQLGTTTGATVKFKFKGTKLRLISYYDPSYPPSVDIYVDGVKSVIPLNFAAKAQALVFEVTGLSLGIHSIEIVSPAWTGSGFIFDAVDIDGTGRLDSSPSTTGALRTTIGSMQIGDYMVCNYQAASGAVGTFSNLGGEVGTELPVLGSDSPNGTFYLIKVDKGLLVADRVVQNSVGWNVLNTGRVIQGLPWDSGTIIPTMTSNTAPNGIASASSEYDVNYQAWKAFNRVSGSAQYWSTPHSVSSGWLAYDFLSAKTIQKYTIKVYYGTAVADRVSDPKDWTFEGWDGAQWVVVHRIIGEIFTTGGEKRAYTFKNNVAYAKYRINITSNKTGVATDGLCLDELEMMETASTIRSITGGVAHADANGNFSNKDLGLGVFPTNNEFDKYIVKSTLGGTVTPNDINVWHHDSSGGTGVAAWCQDTPVNGVVRSSDGNTTTSINTARILRFKSDSSYKSGISWTTSSGIATAYGFRPVFEYKEV